MAENSETPKLGKTKKHVDIQKGIFRKVRKFWRTYQENQNELEEFRTKFLANGSILEEEERRRLISCITGFSDCRARLKT